LRLTRATSVIGAVALAMGAMLAGTPAAASPAVSARTAAAPVTDPASYVNPFIGTQNEGNTYPGATVPLGMVQLSPDTGHGTGYDYGQTGIRGFSLVHLSGVGCGLGGMLPVLPTTGAVTATDYGQYFLPFHHELESAAPGYYSVGMDAPTGGTITAELSATTRTGVQRYTYPKTTHANVMIDAGQALTGVSHSSVTIVDDRTVDATVTVHGFCEETKPFTVHTRTRFDRPFVSSGTWTGDTVTPGSTSADSGDRTGAFLTFDTTSDQTVEAQTSLSYVDAAGAKTNLDHEATGFDQARAAAAASWKARLGKVAVTSDDQTRLRTFYSALYRSYLAPNIGSDADGRYAGRDGAVHTASGFDYYQNYSLWDTYRTQQQFLALTAPRESADMAYSLVLEGQQGGWAARWTYGPVETNIMTGDPVTPFLVSAWAQGLLKGHEEEAYAVLKQNADGVPPADSPVTGRTGNPVFRADGYVPYDESAQGKPGTNDMQKGGSATLEYAVSDGMLSAMAAALGHADDARRYAASGENYRAIFDSGTGAFRARDAGGLFDPEADPANAPGFHEGSAMQYQWLVPQDMPGLVGLLGGKAATAKKLDAFFAYDKLLTDPEGTARNVWVNGPYSYYNQDKYNPNNEPDLGSPYAYLWAGQPWKTTDVVRAALTLFTDGPTGVTGNDDLGEMSAWAVTTSLGLYPIMPGADVWGLSTPVFPAVDIALDPAYYPSGGLHITAEGVSASQHYAQSVTVGGAAFDRGYLTGSELGAARSIDYTVGDTPSAWATGADAAPAAVVSQQPGVHRLTVASSATAIAVAAGATGSLTVHALAQSDGAVAGSLTVTGSDAVTVTGGGSWHVDANGGSAQADIPVQLRVAVGTAPGSYSVRLTVADDHGGNATVDVTVVVPMDSWLQSSFTDVAIGDRGAGNADFDGLGYYFLRDALASVGVVQGQALAVPGTHVSYVLGNAPAGRPDSFRATGQTTDVRAGLAGATAISIVGASTNGTQTGDALLTFTDGSTVSRSIALTDWCSSAENGNIALPAPGVRGDHRGTQSITCGLFATAPIPLPEGKSLRSITWPNLPKMHVLAIAGDGEPAAPHAGTVAISGEARVGNTVTATEPVWDVPGTATAYQWSVNGAAVPDATDRSYVVAACDLGATLSVAVTGRADGYATGTATSIPLTVGAGRFAATTPPAISGEPTVGATLTVTPGAYSVADPRLAYSWTADGVVIDGAATAQLTLGAAQVGARIAAVVTATKPGYDPVESMAEASGPVAPGAPTTYTPTVQVSAKTVAAGGSLTVAGEGFAPGETLRVTLHSTPVLLATATATSDGGLKLSVTVPGDTAPGAHELQFAGETSQTVVTVPLTVTAASTGPGPAGGGGSASGSGSTAGLASAGNLAGTGSTAALLLPLAGLGLLLAAGGVALVIVRRKKEHA
jgi:predicted alpha-1,2-mannosidase